MDSAGPRAPRIWRRLFQNPVGTAVRIKSGEADVRQASAGGGEFLGAAQFHAVVGFLLQAGLGFFKIVRHINLPQTQHLQGHGLHDAQVACQAFGDSGILDLDRKRLPPQRGAVHLTNRGSMGGLRREIIEKRFHRLTEFPLDGAANQRPREWWGGVLRFGKLAGIGRRHQLIVHTQHLGKLERTAFQLAEGLVFLSDQKARWLIFR